MIDLSYDYTKAKKASRRYARDRYELSNEMSSVTKKLIESFAEDSMEEVDFDIAFVKMSKAAWREYWGNDLGSWALGLFLVMQMMVEQLEFQPKDVGIKLRARLIGYAIATTIQDHGGLKSFCAAFLRDAVLMGHQSVVSGAFEMIKDRLARETESMRASKSMDDWFDGVSRTTPWNDAAYSILKTLNQLSSMVSQPFDTTLGGYFESPQAVRDEENRLEELMGYMYSHSIGMYIHTQNGCEWYIGHCLEEAKTKGARALLREVDYDYERLWIPTFLRDETKKALKQSGG